MGAAFMLGSGLALRAGMHVRVELSVPRGQMVGDHHTQTSIVLQQIGDGWAIASLQNTMVSGTGA